MLLCGFSACAFRAADRGCRSAPGLPCALLAQEGGATKQSSGETRREDEKACLRGRRMGRALAKPTMPPRGGSVMGFAALYPSYELDCFAALAMTIVEAACPHLSPSP